jgi:SAM-dependent methyltransferase
VRIRALIRLLSLELFGESLVLAEFPRLKAIRGLGMTDQEGYARILADKFDYTNTYYDREPRFDFTESHEQLAGMYDFILSADVLEHIAPPVERALDEVCRLLKPSGFFGVTIYCNPDDRMREHFPELHEYRVVQMGNSTVLINRRRDGTLEIKEDNLVLHGGSGATLEMREFGITELKSKLLASGFHDVLFLNENVPESGILFDHDVSQPLIARKEAFVMNVAARRQLVDLWSAAGMQAQQERERAEALAGQIRLASQSRWLRLGRMLGVGPKFT